VALPLALFAAACSPDESKQHIAVGLASLPAPRDAVDDQREGV